MAQDEAFSEKLTSLGGLVFLFGWNERKKYLKLLFSIFDPPSRAPQISHYNAMGKFCTGQLHPLEAVKCFDHFTRLFLSQKEYKSSLKSKIFRKSIFPQYSPWDGCGGLEGGSKIQKNYFKYFFLLFRPKRNTNPPREVNFSKKPSFWATLKNI